MEVFFHFINIILKFAGIRTFLTRNHKKDTRQRSAKKNNRLIFQMAKQKYLFFGVGFFFLSLGLIWFLQPKSPLLSITQNSAAKTPYLYEGIVNGTMAVQEITLTKDFLNGVEVRFATMGKVNTSTNTILVLDSNYNLLHREKFSSEEIEDTKYHAFQFKESMKAGKGNKIFICLFSKDGDSANCIHPLFNNSAKLGPLYASVVVNDDYIRSITNKVRLYPGSMIVRTHESDSSLSSAIRWFWYLIATLLSLTIIFTKSIQLFLSRLKIRAEIVYAVIALIFGSMFVMLNPPLQVPDEGSHFSRTMEISELQFSKTGKTTPASVLILDSTFLRLHFNPDEKTSKNEIWSMAKVKLEPTVRRPSGGPDLIVPYLPQVFGLLLGKLFSSSPVILMYFGRLMNLILSLLIIFLAIQITPIGKWTFFLLALMPKTLYMMSSLSYDTLVISTSFLLIALFLYYAFKATEIRWKDIALLFFLIVLLGLSKPPYFLIGLLYFIIPFQKIKSLSKYLLIVPVVLLSLAFAFGIWKVAGEVFKSKDVAKTEQVSGGNNTPAQTPPAQVIDAGKQINYIRDNLPTFTKLLIVTTFDHMRASMLNNFVGTMGWLDTFLPDPLINFYLLVLLIAALFIAEEPVHLDWRRKLLFFIIFITCIVAIETAMYVYSSFVAQTRLFGVQGRYFIPIAPLFLLLFYNNTLADKLNFFFSARKKSFVMAKPNQKPKILLEIQGEQIFMKYLQLFIILFNVIVLVVALAAILLRYYEW